MLNQNLSTVITVPVGDAQSAAEPTLDPLLIQGGIALTTLGLVVALIKALTGLIEASKD